VNAISIQNLKKEYDGRTVIRSFDASFAAGEVVSLVGPSGCGKSTLLRCIVGLETFEGGTITVGKDVLAVKDDAERRRALHDIRLRVGFVFQQWNLFAHRTALGNVVEAPMHVKKMPRAEAEAAGHELLASVGLAHRAMAYPHEMSGGEQQRVAIARALAMKPEVLLLDEPTSALDPARTSEVLGVLRELAKAGKTMILVTHEIAFAREVSHRVLVVHEGGEIIEDGPPGEVLVNPRDARTRQFLQIEGGNR
jgi:polar amino acid transport system ATP-binding protein